MTRLCLVVALACEARPWIDHYRLSAVHGKPFRFYRNAEVALVISGIGASPSAIAAGYLAGVTGAGRDCVWLNAGIAGHPNLEPGTVAVVSKSIGRREQCVHYPSLPIGHDLPSATCITVDEVETAFSENALFDMECAGYFSAAMRFGFLDLVHAVKVVSDNDAPSTGDLDRDKVSALISRGLPAVLDGILEPLLALSGKLRKDASVGDLSAFRHAWRFSVTNERKLHALVSDWQAVHDGAAPDIEQFRDCRGASEVLARMRRELDSITPRW